MPCVARRMPSLLRSTFSVASQGNPNQKCLSNELQRQWKNFNLIMREESLTLKKAVYEEGAKLYCFKLEHLSVADTKA